jgi:hypothetical protein
MPEKFVPMKKSSRGGSDGEFRLEIGCTPTSHGHLQTKPEVEGYVAGIAISKYGALAYCCTVHNKRQRYARNTMRYQSARAR